MQHPHLRIQGIAIGMPHQCLRCFHNGSKNISHITRIGNNVMSMLRDPMYWLTLICSGLL